MAPITLIDEYMYGEDDEKLLIVAKNKCCIAIRRIIKYIK